MDDDRDDTWALSTWTRNRLLERGLRTREQIAAAIEEGGLAKVRVGIGPKALAEARRLVGLDPPLAPTTVKDCCPRCGGDTGYRVSTAVAQLRHYNWQGRLEETSESRVKSEAQAVCRDCDQRFAASAPHTGIRRNS